jgi:DnaK suppressor protein
MFSKVFLKKARDLLLIQRKEILSKSLPDEIDSDGDETDEIQANFIIEMNKQLGSRDSDKLAKIDAALQRIVNKTYGLCEDCEEEVAEKRLLVNPHCTTCISCAETRELEARQRSKV